MKTSRKISLGILGGILALSVAIRFNGCSTSTTSPSNSSGTMRVWMTDAPADFEAVNIVVVKVEAHRADSADGSGWIVLRSDSQHYDLLTLRNGARVVVGEAGLAPGRYSEIRLVLGSGNTVVDSGHTYDLTIPSGMQSGLKLKADVDIVAGQTYELLLDFDAEHSIHETGNGKYMMNPVIRLVSVAATGSISGTILPALTHSTVWTVQGSDTMWAVADGALGTWQIDGLVQGSHTVYVTSGSLLYRDSSISNVAVLDGQVTALGNITLSLK